MNIRASQVLLTQSPQDRQRLGVLHHESRRLRPAETGSAWSQELAPWSSWKTWMSENPHGLFFSETERNSYISIYIYNYIHNTIYNLMYNVYIYIYTYVSIHIVYIYMDIWIYIYMIYIYIYIWIYLSAQEKEQYHSKPPPNSSISHSRFGFPGLVPPGRASWAATAGCAAPGAASASTARAAAAGARGTLGDRPCIRCWGRWRMKGEV